MVHPIYTHSQSVTHKSKKFQILNFKSVKIMQLSNPIPHDFRKNPNYDKKL